MGIEDPNGGAPSKFKEEHIQAVDEYLALNQDTDDEVNLPTVEGFAGHLGVAKSTLYEWEKKSQEFSDALKKILIEQHKRLINKGLIGKYNPTIAKLILSSNHGYKEKSDVTTDDKPIEGVVVLPAKESANE